MAEQIEDQPGIDPELKKKLLNGLATQQQLMIENAELMERLFEDGNSNAIELAGAAKITGDWINAIERY